MAHTVDYRDTRPTAQVETLTALLQAKYDTEFGTVMALLGAIFSAVIPPNVVSAVDALLGAAWQSTIKWTAQNRKVNATALAHGTHAYKGLSFDIPAGYTCSKADVCLVYANKVTGVIAKGKKDKYGCYAANLEAFYTSKRIAVWSTFDTLRKVHKSSMTSIDKVYAYAHIIVSTMPKRAKIVRIHSHGDFFSVEYFLAWVLVAKLLPAVKFYGYSKHLVYVRVLADLNLDNLRAVYSLGGKDDLLLNPDIDRIAWVTPSLDDAQTVLLPNGTSFVDDVACKFSTDPSDFDAIYAGRNVGLHLH